AWARGARKGRAKDRRAAGRNAAALQQHARQHLAGARRRCRSGARAQRLARRAAPLLARAYRTAERTGRRRVRRARIRRQHVRRCQRRRPLNMDRRKFLSSAAFGAVAASGVSKAALARLPEPEIQTSAATAPPRMPDSGRPYNPVVTLNGWTAPWRMNAGVKEFPLVAEPVEREIAPGMVARLWGYNGQSPGPTIEVVEGDRVRIFVTNRLPEHTSIHWHGQRLPSGMDGVAGLNQRAIPVGKTYVYEFVARRPGTFMYHPHADEMVQM